MKQLLQNLRNGETQVGFPRRLARPGCALVRTAASLVSAGTERMVVDFAGKSLLGKARSRPDLVRQVLDKAQPRRAADHRRGSLQPPGPADWRWGTRPPGRLLPPAGRCKNYRVGQRVACAGGGLCCTRRVRGHPQANLLASLPDEVDFEAGAFATLGAIALHGFRLAEAQSGRARGGHRAGLARAAGGPDSRRRRLHRHRR